MVEVLMRTDGPQATAAKHRAVVDFVTLMRQLQG